MNFRGMKILKYSLQLMETKLYLQKKKMTETLYHIYLRNKCIYHSLPEDEFNLTWKMISEFLSITDDSKKNDLSYEKVIKSKDLALNSSH
jgi:hypothetical protein